jgi:cell pole-organizing protein PopZ
MAGREPSMEDILASIKKVIAEEKELRSAGQIAAPLPRPELQPEPEQAEPEHQPEHRAEYQPEHEVLELEEPMVEDIHLPPADLGPPLISEDAAEASRKRLEALQQVAASAPPAAPASNPLEQVVREMLRPILKEWLEQNLPAIVDEHVKREITRITGQPL